MNWYKLKLAANVSYLSHADYIKRLQALGFQIRPTNRGHVLATHPTGVADLSGAHNWSDKGSGIDNKRQALKRELKANGIPERNLDFALESKFIIPPNFNIKTLQYEQDKPTEKMRKAIKVKILPNVDMNYLVGSYIKLQEGGNFQKIINISPSNNGINIKLEGSPNDIFLKNNSFVGYP
jgi:hypothetical protein